MRVLRTLPLILASAAACSAPAASIAPDPAPEPVPEPIAVDVEPMAPALDWSDRDLPFESSADDRAYLGTGFTGYFAVPEGTGYSQGVRCRGVQPTGALGRAGMKNDDVIVSLAGHTLTGPQDELIQELREVLKGLAPDTWTTLAYWRKDVGITPVELLLGRQPPRFDRLMTDEGWFRAPVDTQLAELAGAALALDEGEARLADTLSRQRRRFAKRDVFRLKETVQAQMSPFAQEELAWGLTYRLGGLSEAAALAAGLDAAPAPTFRPGVREGGLANMLNHIEEFVVAADARARAAVGWTGEERAWVAENVHLLTERFAVEGDYLYGDENVERERANRRLITLLERVDRRALAQLAVDVQAFSTWAASGIESHKSSRGSGLLGSRDTSVGRIEIWGTGNQRHTKRCVFRYDRDGNDNYLDCAARADLTQPISISVDQWGDDTYGSTASFSQAGALGGIAWLIDSRGDDQYLGRQWCQGAAIAGVAALVDERGADVYRSLECAQGVGLVGAGTLLDGHGADTYTAQRFSQGVGFAAGVGALVDVDGNDRYACTGQYGSEYGEAGLYSGWGQGVGFGFRRVTSGGIGVLYDAQGDDVYEAGNFSQGGAYFYAWGILRDRGNGDDRYIGSRYAQGYAAHQAAGTFIEEGGDDLYQSHSNVAQGLSWDETSVFFHDHGGNDRYETSGFSLASAAHNGMVVFIDGAGDDWYRDLPGKASSNNYHGGWSFALFADYGGRDTYGDRDVDAWNDRVHLRHDGAYILDLPSLESIDDLKALLRVDAD